MGIKIVLLLLLSATAVLHSAEIDKAWQIFIPEKPTPTEQKAADEILANNEKAVNEYKEGSMKVFGFLMGQMCKRLGNSANPQVIRQILIEKLEKLK